MGCSEYLRSVPDLLETMISEKRFLQAAIMLVQSSRLISKPEMLEIGALVDLRSFLTSQESYVLCFFRYPQERCLPEHKANVVVGP